MYLGLLGFQKNLRYLTKKSTFNQALLGKWLLRYATEEEVMETCYLHELFEIMGEWTREELRESDCQRRTLGQLMKNHLMRVASFHKFLKFSIGMTLESGFVSFDTIHGVVSPVLQAGFLICLLEVDMDATIASYLNGE